MARSHPAPGRRIRRLWRFLENLPAGSWLFSRLLGWMAPYTGTMGAHVRQLEPGWCRAELRDRRRVRNHLDSIHAVALLNLGELVTGLATVTAVPAGVRGIIVGLEAEYRKKARGRLRAECRSEPPEVDGSVDHSARAEIRDRSGDLVATVNATWRLAPDEGTLRIPESA